MEFSKVKEIKYEELKKVYYDREKQVLFGLDSLGVLYKKTEDGSWLELKRLNDDFIKSITISPKIDYRVHTDGLNYYLMFDENESVIWRIDINNFCNKYELLSLFTYSGESYLLGDFKELIKMKDFDYFIKYHFFKNPSLRIRLDGQHLVKERGEFVLITTTTDRFNL